VRVLKEAKGLTELQLSGNNIQDKGVEILTHGLLDVCEWRCHQKICRPYVQKVCCGCRL
jgi:hypothetical protein